MVRALVVVALFVVAACTDEAAPSDAGLGDAEFVQDSSPPRDSRVREADVDASSMDSSASSCSEQFGDAPDFLLCAEDSDSCTFNARTAGGTCRELCESFGSTCLDAFDNPMATDLCVPGTADGCDTPRTDEICVCSKGGTVPVCSDLDGDGYGTGLGCLGADCDEASDTCWEGSCCDALPAPLRVVEVCSSAAFNEALGAAVPGDHIVLCDGSFGGFTATRPGSAEAPIVVRAEETLGARLTSGVNLEGDHVWIVGADFAEGHHLNIRGTGNRASRNRIRNDNVGVFVDDTARRAVIDHNEIDMQGTGASEDRKGIEVQLSRAARDAGEPVGHHFYRNHLHSVNGNVRGNTAINVSNVSLYRLYRSGIVIEYNLFENWRGGRQISLKCGGVIVRFNTSINPGTSRFVNRLGTSNQWIANWAEGRIRIHDHSHLLMGNRGTVEIRSGNILPSDIDPLGPDFMLPGYIINQDTVAVGNQGALLMGFNYTDWDQHPVRDTVIEAHDGPITFGNHVGTRQSPTTTRSVPSALRLMPADVGPFSR